VASIFKTSVGFEALAAVTMKSYIVWDITLHTPVKVNCRTTRCYISEDRTLLTDHHWLFDRCYFYTLYSQLLRASLNNSAGGMNNVLLCVLFVFRRSLLLNKGWNLNGFSGFSSFHCKTESIVLSIPCQIK
jgi:hypothetical protein